MFFTSLSRSIRTALFACALAMPLAASADQFVPISGHLPPVLASAQRLNRVAADEHVSLALVLPLRNQDQLNDLLRRLYTPGDILYGQYLTPETFARQFSPTQAEYDTIIAFAQSRGLTVTAVHPNRTVLDVTGSVSAVESAFGVQLDQYKAADGRVFRAPSNEPQVPAVLAGHLAAVIGLDTAAVWKPHSIEKKAPAAGAKSAQFDPHQIGSGPGGGLTPSDIKAAYNLNGINANGAGQSLALFELTGYTASDITAYESYYGLPNVPVQNILVDNFSGAPGNGADEVTLDIQLQIAVAPAISKIYVYEGPNSALGVIDTYNRIATDNLAKSVSTSWGTPEFSSNSSVRNGENQAFQQMAAQGQSIFAASGDHGAYDNKTSVSVDDPACQPYMTGVGGTSLSTSGTGGAWASETTWNGGSISAGAGGGGVSGIWSKPSYQGSYGASATGRNVPDVSLDSDPNTGYSIYYGGSWRIYGGTSCAAPIWSAFVACVNQARVAAGKSTLGFANPLIYQLGASANYSTDFHDVADNSTNLYYAATTGYDNATGWGTINGVGLFADLVNGGAITSSQTTTVYQLDSGGGATGGFAADNYFTGGSNYSVGQTVNTTGVTSAAPSSVYQSLRYGSSFAYNLPNLTPGATYTVRLHFAEVYFTSAGRRIFNVTVNGASALTNLDIVAAAGANKALVKEITAIADTNGKINVSFKSVADNAQVNGIEVISGGSSGGSNSAPSAPTNLTTSPGNAQVGMSWNAVSGATSYKVYRSTTSGSGYTMIGTPTGTTGNDTSVTNGTTYYYVVTAVNSAGESTSSSEVSATPSTSIAVYQLNCGGGASGVFGTDAYFNGGSTYGVSQAVSTAGVTNAAPAGVYQSLRYGNFAYNMPNLTPGATYTVRLHFAEVYFTTAGQRVFNVAINGTKVLNSFDIVAAGGANKAVVQDFTAVADSNGKINIAFTTVVNNAQVNGIEIIR